jgi:hypothetical protein
VSLSLTNFNAPAVTIDQSAIALRQIAIQDAREITTIQSPGDVALATEVVRSLKQLSSACEAARTQIKAPVLDLGRQIDAKAKEFSAQLDTEASRILRMVGSYQAEQERLREAELRRQQQVRERIERERIEAERKALEEAKGAQTEQQLELAEAKIEQVAVVAEQAKAQIAPVAPVQAVKGLSVKPVLRFEVVDIATVYKFNPQFVELSAKASVINAALKAGITEIPGLRIYEDVTTRVR